MSGRVGRLEGHNEAEGCAPPAERFVHRLPVCSPSRQAEKARKKEELREVAQELQQWEQARCWGEAWGPAWSCVWCMGMVPPWLLDVATPVLPLAQWHIPPLRAGDERGEAAARR